MLPLRGRVLGEGRLGQLARCRWYNWVTMARDGTAIDRLRLPQLPCNATSDDPRKSETQAPLGTLIA